MSFDVGHEQFKKSLLEFEDYPTNLTPHNALPNNTEAYIELLNSREEQLFCSEQNPQCQLRFWECNDPFDGFQFSKARSVSELDSKLRTGSKDPKCRFVFISAPSQRSRLNTTRQMAELLFSFHQVMPSYLDFVVTFGNRHYAQEFPFAGFRQQLRLSDTSRGQMVQELGRSGQDLSLCFNLRSVERSNDPCEWAIRQSAIYHTFDTLSGCATWIVTNPNLITEKRIRSATGKNASANIVQVSKNSEAFAASLLTHLTFVDWAGENWRWYIDFLEDKAQSLTRPVLQMPVQKPKYSAPASPMSPRFLPTRSATRSSSWGLSSIMSEKTFTEERKLHSPRRLPSICTNLLSKSNSHTISPASAPEPFVKAEEKGFRIEDIQENQSLEDKTNETMLVLDANLNVLEELVKFYKSALNSDDMPQDIRTRCQADYERFAIRVEGVKNDLRMQRSRAKSILRLLSDRKNLLFGILECQNMEASRVLAEKAQSSAQEMQLMTEDMHDIARQTKQETVSMRIITLVTLFFLPGTFISTLMSTDIIRWQPKTTEGLKKSVSLEALQFFIIITVPLMTVTFLAWYVVYRCVKRKDKLVHQHVDLESQVQPQERQKCGV